MVFWIQKKNVTQISIYISHPDYISDKLCVVLYLNKREFPSSVLSQLWLKLALWFLKKKIFGFR